MKVVIEGLGVTFGGGRTYLENLVRQLLADGVDLHVVTGCELGIAAAESRGRVHVTSLPRPQLLWRVLTQIGIRQIGLKADVLISSSEITMLFGSVPRVLVCQNPNIWGETYPLFSREGLRLRGLRMLNFASAVAAHRIVFLSADAQSRSAVGRRFASKARVVPYGIDTELFTPRGLGSRAPSVGVRSSKPYILSVSTIYRVKNFVRLIEAFARTERVRAEYDLVIAGRAHESDVALEILRTAAESGVSDRVHLLEEVPHDRLPDLYRGARAFVFPSYSETFGLPPVEAMACGTPVAAARAGSIPEVCGDGALYFDPFDADDMARTIERVVYDEGVRADLIHRGEARAALFTWERSAAILMEVAREAVGARSALRQHQ